MATLYEQVVTMVKCECAECNIIFGMPERYNTERRNDHKSFYCPNGHPQYYPAKSDLEKAKEQAAKEKQALEYQLRDAQRSKEYWHNEYHNKRKEAISLKGQKTRITNRIKNGVCVCCNRTFKDLAAHMKTQHPEHK